MSSPCVWLNTARQKLAPSAGVAFVCFAYQSCENNRVCVCLSSFQVVRHIWALRPHGTAPHRTAPHACVRACVLSAVTSGYKGNTPGWRRQSVSFDTKVMAATTRQTRRGPPFQLGGLFLPTCDRGDRRMPSGRVLEMPFRFQSDWR